MGLMITVSQALTGSPAAHEDNVLSAGLMKIEDHSISQIR
jgi:hypothetical protein